MLLIVGLGNIGKEYENTFHNMGFMAVDAIAERFGVELKRAECSALTAVTQKGGEKIVLAKPTTYMNLSGGAVKSLLAKYGAELSELIVLYDDIDIGRFSVRVRAEGSGGTHNGMRNIIQVLNRTEFKRIRIGVGRNDGDLKDYVLSKINLHDRAEFQKTFDRIADAVVRFAQDKDFEKLQRELNAEA